MGMSPEQVGRLTIGEYQAATYLWVKAHEAKEEAPEVHDPAFMEERWVDLERRGMGKVIH